jgi:hypothetical protein
MDALAARTLVVRTNVAGADGEIVWSWPPDAEVKRAERSVRDGSKRARFPGRSRISRNPSRGECRMIRLNLWFLPRAFFTARGPWVKPSPCIPCALCCKRAARKQSFGRKLRRGNAGGRACRCLTIE